MREKNEKKTDGHTERQMNIEENREKNTRDGGEERHD